MGLALALITTILLPPLQIILAAVVEMASDIRCAEMELGLVLPAKGQRFLSRILEMIYIFVGI